MNDRMRDCVGGRDARGYRDRDMGKFVSVHQNLQIYKTEQENREMGEIHDTLSEVDSMMVIGDMEI